MDFNTKEVGKAVRKKNAMELLLGRARFTEEYVSPDALLVGLVRSPHAFARVRKVYKQQALSVPGVVGVYSFEDVPKKRFATAGQVYPEMSPYDRLILDEWVRYVGDPAAIVAAVSKQALEEALEKVIVEYEVLDPVLDFRTAMQHSSKVHPEADYQTLVEFGADPAVNLCATDASEAGDVDAVLQNCPWTVEETYHTLSNNQCMAENFRTFCWLDEEKRLNVISSTQIPFHIRRILSHALDISKEQIKVMRPQIGGGFGSKQTAVCEMYPAFVTWKTGRPSYLTFSREESFLAGSPRHEMEIRVKVGADADGLIRGIVMETLSNTGAYGEHGATTIGLSGHKSIPLYRFVRDFRFTSKAVYTNTVPAGAFRGFGATQGTFALESAVNELAAKMGLDPVQIRERNMVREGDPMPAYGYGLPAETASSCALDQCMARAKEMIGWGSRPMHAVLPNGHLRGLGAAMGMQGSGIAGVDIARAKISLRADGRFSLQIGSVDMGTGSNTTLAQVAAEELEVPTGQIVTLDGDTDQNPYDTGSYASSTMYVTGGAVQKACLDLKEKMQGRSVQEWLKLARDTGAALPCGEGENIQQVSPPPFMVGMAEVDVDPQTGAVEVVDYVGVVDCGTAVNPNLVRVQTEGGILQGIGMALTEDVRRGKKGQILNRSFLQYGVPTRLECPNIRVDFCSSYEKTGPFGAKSIGEVVINPTAPAIMEAIYQACGVRIRSLPALPEKILRGMGVL